jgi:secondary thiamine-phosphate synthase enzyme
LLKTIHFETHQSECLVNFTPLVTKAVKESGVKEGICVIFTPHTTAGLIINSALDPNTANDIITEVKKLVPTRVDFKHTYDTPADAAGHIKSSLVGCNLSLIVTGGEVLLGSSQSILFYEFDGPRKRMVHIRTIAETD